MGHIVEESCKEGLMLHAALVKKQRQIRIKLSWESVPHKFIYFWIL